MGKAGRKPGSAKPIEDRFWSKVEQRDGSCWPWQGATFQKSGYGRFTMSDDTSVMAHRIAWTLAGRKLNEDQRLLNLCGNRTCINPEHWVPEVPPDELYQALNRLFHIAKGSDSRTELLKLREQVRALSTRLGWAL